MEKLTYKFCMVGGYTEDFAKPQSCQNWGWVLAQKWTLAWGNMVLVVMCKWYSGAQTSLDNK